MAKANGPGAPWEPNITPQPDGSWIFELRDDVWAHVKGNLTTKKADVQMWRKETILLCGTGRLNDPEYRKKLIKLARGTNDGFNSTEEQDEDGNVLFKAGQDRIPNIEESVYKMAVQLHSTGPGGESLLDKPDAKRPIPERLVEYATDAATLFHDSDRRAYASVDVGDHVETYDIEQERFDDWLEYEFDRREEERLLNAERARAAAMGGLYEGLIEDNILPTPIIREGQRKDAKSKLRALAKFKGPEQDVYIRVAPGDDENGRGVYFDLGDDEWRAVHITAKGFEVVHNPPVKFIRPAHMRPEPAPVLSESADELRALLNLPHNPDGDRNWQLMLTWLVYSFVPGGKYPILLIGGRKGSAKSTSEKILKLLLDPTKAPIRTKPQSERDLYVEADSCWCLAFNNFSTIADWLSNAFCNLSTGGGLGLRKMWTGRDLEVFDATRPIMINGIGDVATRDDILDRAITIELPDISEENRKVEEDIFQRFEEIRPHVLGFIFSALSAGLGRVDSVKRERLPRMADFTIWGIATEEALGGEAGSFRKAYGACRDIATGKAVEATPINATLFDLAESYSKDEPWVGTSTELWEKLGEMAGENLRRMKAWPGSPSVLSQHLNRMAVDLAKVGVHVWQGKSHKDKSWRVYYQELTGDGGDGRADDAVPNENRTGKPKSEAGGRGDGGDGSTSPTPPKNDEDNLDLIEDEAELSRRIDDELRRYASEKGVSVEGSDVDDDELDLINDEEVGEL